MTQPHTNHHSKRRVWLDGEIIFTQSIYLSRKSPITVLHINPTQIDFISKEHSQNGTIPLRLSTPSPAMLSLDMNDKVFFVAFLCVATSSLALIWKRKRSGAKLPFPPGPKGLPLLGNVLDIPKDVPIWVAFTSTAQKFSMYQLCPSFPCH